MDGNYYEFFWWVGVLVCGLWSIAVGALLGVAGVLGVRRLRGAWKIYRLRKSLEKI